MNMVTVTDIHNTIMKIVYYIRLYYTILYYIILYYNYKTDIV